MKNIKDTIEEIHKFFFHEEYRVISAVIVAFIILFSYIIISDLVYIGVSQDLANKDFANYWIASRLVLSEQTMDLFGPWSEYFQHLRKQFGENYPWHNWSYPPHYIFFILPLGFLEYKISMIVFLLVTGLFFLYFLKLYAQERIDWAVFVSTPFILLNTWIAQNGFLTGGLALGALALRERRPILAGILLGGLTVKPQLGILFPILLLAERRWRVMISAAVSSLVLVALSALVFGVESWSGYLNHVIPYQTLVMREFTGSFHTMMPSVYGLARRYGIEADSALLSHAVVAVPLTFLTIGALFRLRDPRAREALTLTATFIVTPYALNYDFGLLVGALTILAPHRDRFLREPLVVRALIGSVILLPVVMMPLGKIGIPIAPPILLGVFAIILVAFTPPLSPAPPRSPARAAGRQGCSRPRDGQLRRQADGGRVL